MLKWREIIRFIKKYRKLGVASFFVSTNSDTFIITVRDKEKDIYEQLKLKYK